MKSLLSLFVILAGLFAAVPLTADELGDAQHRIQARQGELADLKEKGAIGENNRGYTEVRESVRGADTVSSAENRDRGIIYDILASRTGTTADAVGRARAKQIAAQSRPGVWVQDESGRWSRK